MTIIKPSATDFDELTQLWEASVRATHTFLKEVDIQFFKPLVREQYLLAVNIHCIKDGNTITGFIGTIDNSIEMLFVLPSARGTGIGKALLQFALDYLGCDKVDVNEQNEQAVGFYERMGFEVTGRSDTDAMGKPYPILHMAVKNTDNTIAYKFDVMPTAQEIIELYKSAGLNRPVHDESRIIRMYDNSNLIVTAWKGSTLVGVARSLTDFSYCCYLSDLAVKDDYKKQGIGKKLIELTKKKLGEQVMLLLLSAPGAMEYYPKIGFETVQNGFIIHRKS